MVSEFDNSASTSISRNLVDAQRNVADSLVREQAIDISDSWIVQAPAGSGKTTLLVARYLKLLAHVKQPEEILAITFTRKAAKEMRQRVLRALRDETEDAKPAIANDKLCDWNLLANPQRMRVQTIDSFVFSLVQRLPYESQLSLDYTCIENARDLFAEAVENVFYLLNTRHPFVPNMARALAYLDNDFNSARQLFTRMLDNREMWITSVVQIVDMGRNGKSRELLFQKIQSARSHFIDALAHELWDIIKPELRARITAICEFRAANIPEGPVPFTKFDNHEDLKFFAETVLTSDGRKFIERPNKRHGFPVSATKEKSQLRQITSDLNELEVLNYLQLCKYVSDVELRDSQLQAIHDYAVVLLLIMQELTALFRRSEVVDFTEMAIGAERALASDNMPTELALALDYRISHILIDEYQDTSASQARLLNLLMAGWEVDDGNTFFAVGDPMQAIYQFRNADLSNFLRAYNEGLPNRSLRPLKLSTNFRSSPDLVRIANALFKSIFGAVEHVSSSQVAFTPSESYRIEPGYFGVTIVRSANIDEEASQVARKISELTQKQNNESIALLVRTRTHLDSYFAALRKEGLSWRGVEIVKLEDLPVVRDLFALSCVLIDANDTLSWLSVLRSPMVGLELLDLERIESNGISPFTLINAEHELQSVSRHALKLLDRIRGPLQEALESTHRSIRSRVERLWYQLGGNDAYQERSRQVNYLTDAERFLDVLEGMQTEAIDPKNLWKRIESMYASETETSADVEVMTIHKAKGLEFDHVVVPNIDSTDRTDDPPLLNLEQRNGGLLASVHGKFEIDSLHSVIHENTKTRSRNELKRLFYVAVTRARKSLWLYGSLNPKRKLTSKGGSDVEPNSFLNLLRPLLSDKSIPFVEITSDQSKPASKVETRQNRNVWTRLDESYEFRANVDLVPFDSKILLNLNDDESASSIPIGPNVPITVGNIVHQELHRMVQTKTIAAADRRRVTQWRNKLRTLGHTGIEISTILEQVQRQIGNVLADPIGSWILDDKHLESQSEVSYDSSFDGSLDHYVVDRTFIDSDNVRWIIDYKTTFRARDTAIELRELAENYRDQLERYCLMFSRMDERPIKGAIYFTDVPYLVQLF